ncbi:phage terminase large subunit family protein, partial [Xylella fastidiosa subsp. multiplex]|nr:phage terminase large subunit family protein [Xylella fastidiosa subsp. multiplex]MBE0276477.1 phage terminase large subunit family protein [Xylella fastidiosa subsp. multiplex]MBE0278689.1 phage terminase large subunit family protein [Xylella fastidiosa subsp. multiplex]MBE0283096.1 phage terminase large subunit family protein [Xylella fastidiosa subsp. multiplex]
MCLTWSGCRCCQYRKMRWSGQSRILETPHGFLKQTLYLVRGRAEIKSDRAVYRPSKTTVDERGKTLARDVGVWGVGTSVLKHM